MDPNHSLVRRFATINPYRLAYALVRQRLSWDLDRRGRESRRRLRGLLNRNAGEKAVILCNGPSLLKSDLSLLDGVFTFGLNKINLLYERSPFRPSCIVSVNALVLEQNADFFNATDTPLFLSSRAAPHIRMRDNVVFLKSTNYRAFAKDCSMDIYEGSTVTFVALQLAFHLGFTDVAIIGADHYFATQGLANKTVTAGAVDENHFDPRYFAGGVQWQLPDLMDSEIAYAMARNMYWAHGRRLVNATAGGHLEIFPRMELAEFIGSRHVAQ